MSNVIAVYNRPQADRSIADMGKGEVGYVVPWAFDGETNTLDTNYRVHPEPTGAATLKVTAIFRDNAGIMCYTITYPNGVN